MTNEIRNTLKYQPTKFTKNFTSKFTFIKQTKRHLLAFKSYQCLNDINVNSSKLLIDVYMSPYLIFLLILEFFPARLDMLLYGHDSNVTKLPANCQLNILPIVILF